MLKNKTKHNLKRLTLTSLSAIFLSLWLSACGGLGSESGFTIADNWGCPTCGGQQVGQEDGSSQEGTSPNVPNPPQSRPDYTLTPLKATVNGGAADSAIAVDIDRANNALLLVVPLTLPNLLVGDMEADILELPGAKVTSYTDLKTGYSMVAFSIPFKYVLRGVQFANPGRLPNGDPLPSIASGELPSISVKLPGSSRLQVQLYLGVSVAAVFVGTPLDPYIRLTYNIRNEAQNKIVGTFSTVPEKNGHRGGFFMSTLIPDDIARYLDDYF